MDDLLCQSPQLYWDLGHQYRCPWPNNKGMETDKNYVYKWSRQVLETQVDNGTITSQIQETPKLILNLIQTTIKADKHFWHYCDELVSDLWLKPDEPIHSLQHMHNKTHQQLSIFQQQYKSNIQNDNLTTCSQIPQGQGLALLKRPVTTHIWQALFLCGIVETWSKQFQKAKENSCTKLTTITAAIASTTLIHQGSLNAQLECRKCSDNHTKSNCSMYRRDCYNCDRKGHFTSLCRRPRKQPSKDEQHPRCQRSI